MCLVRHGARRVGWGILQLAAHGRLTFVCSDAETVNKIGDQIGGKEVLSEVTEIIPYQNEV